MSENTLAIL